MSNNNIDIIIGGDFVPIGAGTSLFVAGDAVELVGEDLLNVIHRADFSVFNLEVPLTDTKTPIAKCGPNLIAQTASVAGLCAVNRGAFALANNHILDQGGQGLNSTICALDAVGAPYFGAGTNLSEAAKPYIYENGGVKIGFYACAEHEFSIAGEDQPGANPFDPFESLDHVATLKSVCDYVVVLYHGGKEHYRYPSPMLQKTCRKIAEKGADLIVCQHSHCIGCMEEYAGATIVYGQGNFLFDDAEDDNEFWATGLLLKVAFARCVTEERDVLVEYLPIRKKGIGVRLAQGEVADQILEDFKQRSMDIMRPGVVEEEYAKFADATLDYYLNMFLPGSRTIAFRVIDKLTGGGLVRLLTNDRRALREINGLECEAHRELYVQGLKMKIEGFER